MILLNLYLLNLTRAYCRSDGDGMSRGKDDVAGGPGGGRRLLVIRQLGSRVLRGIHMTGFHSDFRRTKLTHPLCGDFPVGCSLLFFLEELRQTGEAESRESPE